MPRLLATFARPHGVGHPDALAIPIFQVRVFGDE